ncbi:putative RNA-binding protein [Gregarina niphandrodes]|uniref:RNA-binding protein n=1 Tax=Gregarina niphandrodes TaxID=110365 RepID=A0A023B7E6_GRENI|nr:putative RNA-binding protein [Gregarina niphandrodes]EZG67301.1 putative RNA-binding protein [Gregarina niphandrodes]|eukprot:XP_011130271.1 putative RNA-binding protein [Gregarina niphandrodes]
MSADNRRVYVGNLAWRVRWQDLKDHMKQAGEVRYVEIIESDGRSKGCGIVEYADAESAERAIQTLSDSMLFDRKMFVREDREGRRNPTRGYEVRIPPPTEETNGRQLYVNNLPWSTTWTELKDLFGGNDEVERSDIATDRDGRSRGFGCVIMKTAELANQKIDELNDKEWQGRRLLVKLDQGPKREPIA